MGNMRNAVEFMLWTGMDTEDVYDALKEKFPTLTTSYVVEVLEMMETGELP